MDEKLWYGSGIVAVLAGVGYWLDLVTVSEIKVGAGLGVAVLGFWYMYANQEKLRKKAEDITGQRRSLHNALTEEEMKEKIREWNSAIKFPDNGYKTDSVPLWWEAEEGKPEDLWYFYTLSGPNNNPALVFIDSTSGRIKGHHLFRSRKAAKASEKAPFKYSARYNEYDKDRESRTRRYRPRRRSNSSGSGGDEVSVGDMTEEIEID